MENRLQITHESEIRLGETIIPCYVLENGTRILSSMEMQKSLKMIEPKSGTKNYVEIARIFSSKNSKTLYL